MKLTAILFLVMLMGVVTFSKNLLLAGYTLNKEWIAASCINKSIPKFGCEGKCQVMKLMNEEESHNPEPVPLKTPVQELLYSFKPSSFIFKPCKSTQVAPAGFITQPYGSIPADSIFHPPSAS